MMAAPQLRLTLGAAIVIVAGCTARQAAMPEGYEAISDSHGLRANGVRYEAGVATAPVSEIRAGGDYALYPVSTDCAGRFAVGEGTVFASDGTVRQSEAALSWRSAADHPHLSPLLARICELSLDARWIPDPFDAGAALTLLLGDSNPQGEVRWLRDFSGRKQELLVSMRQTGSFLADGTSRHFILTGSRDPECEANSCGPGVVGAATFLKTDGRWKLERHQAQLIEVGQFGAAPMASEFELISKPGAIPVIRIDSECFGNGGYCSRPVEVVTWFGGEFRMVWSGASRIDTNASSECVEYGRCSDAQSHIRVVDAPGDSHPNLVVKTTGQLWLEESQKLVAVDEELTYRFDLLKRTYVESARTGGRRELPKPKSRAEQDAEAAAAEQVRQAQLRDREEQWQQECIANSGRVRTLAGSLLSLEVHEAAQLCSCIRSQEPTTATAVEQARQQCLQRMM